MMPSHLRADKHGLQPIEWCAGRDWPRNRNLVFNTELCHPESNMLD
jgi:hypothetical protein